MARKFYRDEENPYDVILGVKTTEFRDEVKMTEPNLEPTGDFITNFDEVSRRLNTAGTGAVKVGLPGGLLVADSISGLRTKSYTCFETSARFTSAVSGSGTATFDVNGLVLETGATATSHVLTTWAVTANVFSSSPTFSANVVPGSPALGVGKYVVGLGTVAVSGTDITFNSSFCGFLIHKTGGVETLYAVQSNGVSSTQSAALTTIDGGNESIDLIVKVNTDGSIVSSVDYFFKKFTSSISQGTISSKTTLLTTVPIANISTASFGVTNVATAVTFRVVAISSSYER